MYVYFTFWLVQITSWLLVITGILQPTLKICTRVRLMCEACIVASAFLQQRLQLLTLIVTIVASPPNEFLGLVY